MGRLRQSTEKIQELLDKVELETNPFEKGEGNNSAVLKGGNNKAKGPNSLAEGLGTITSNEGEHASGRYNHSTESPISFIATLFSIGMGTSGINRKNAFEVKRNGNIYIYGIDEPIQDKLEAATQSEIDALFDGGTSGGGSY